MHTSTPVIDDKLKILLNKEKNIMGGGTKENKASLSSLLNIALQTNFLLITGNDFNFSKEYLKSITNS
jgi:hypothetical protein